MFSDRVVKPSEFLVAWQLRLLSLGVCKVCVFLKAVARLAEIDIRAGVTVDKAGEDDIEEIR